MKRERATEAGFIWIPTGNIGGVESGIVGYWHGETKNNHSGTKHAVVECLVDDGFAYPLVSLNALYQATEADIDAELDGADVQQWRDLRN